MIGQLPPTLGRASFGRFHGIRTGKKTNKKMKTDTHNAPFFSFTLNGGCIFNMGTFLTLRFILNISWVFFPRRREVQCCCQDWTRSWETCSLNSGSETVGGRLFGGFFKWFLGKFQDRMVGISIPKFWEKWNPIWFAHIFVRWVGEQPPTRGTIVTMVCFQPWIWLIWLYSPLITGSTILVWFFFPLASVWSNLGRSQNVTQQKRHFSSEKTVRLGFL